MRGRPLCLGVLVVARLPFDAPQLSHPPVDDASSLPHGSELSLSAYLCSHAHLAILVTVYRWPREFPVLTLRKSLWLGGAAQKPSWRMRGVESSPDPQAVVPALTSHRVQQCLGIFRLATARVSGVRACE